VADSGASDSISSLRERRQRRELARRRRVRRRRLTAAMTLLGAGALVAGLVSLTGRGAPRPPAPGATRALVTVRATPAGALAAAVQDAAVAVAGGRVVLAGGIDAAGSSTGAIVALGGAGAITARLPERQHDAQAVSLAEQVYVFGGGDIASYDHIVAFDPAGGPARYAGRLPSLASDVAVAALGGTVYVVGGFDGVAPLDTIVAWRPGGVARVVARLPLGLRYAAVAAVAGRLLIAGGTTASGVSDAILSYDPASGTVLQVGVLPGPLTHASAVTLGGRVYVVGGRHAVSGAQTAQIIEIDPVSAVATVVGELPRPLSDAAVARVHGHIVVAGGEDAAGATQRAVLTLTPHVQLVAVHAPHGQALARARLEALGARGYGPALLAHPSSIAPYEAAAARPGLPGYLLIADRGNNRILVVNPQGNVVWRFPDAADVAAGRILHFNDDTFVEPGGRALIANEEDYGAVVSVAIASRRITLLFGVPGQLGGGRTHLNYPDDAYAFANGSFTVADAYNCRILFVREHRIVRQYGTAGDCRHDPPRHFGAVNGDTPTPYGGVLVSEIPGHWIDAINANGSLRWSVQAPVAYPSDPQPLPGDRVLLADYSDPGHVIVMDSRGHVSWRYGPAAGESALNHPSLAMELPNGDIAVNDDYRDRVVVIDPRSDRIVWQYGHTDVTGTAPGYLNTPDGMDFIPAAPNGSPDWAAVVHP
jgi:outer membrane protein assembly factor BamB